MQPGKWIKDLAPDTAVEDAAWRVLTIRFDTVRQTLQEALEEGDDPEAVHQLRVATRRAGAALWLFRDSLSAKAAKKTKRCLSAIRQKAGEIRDGDILLDRLRKSAKELAKEDRPAIDFLLGYLTAQRLPGEAGFSRSAAKFPDKFDKRSSSVVGTIEPAKPDMTLGDLARDSLSSQLRKLDRAVSEDSHDLADLHQARIIAKRLRYSMEIVAGCYRREFRDELYPVIVELQEVLGEIHDHDVSSQLYRNLGEQLPEVLKKRAKRYRPTLEKLVHYHQDAIAAALPQYDAWRASWRKHHANLANMLENGEANAPANSGAGNQSSTAASSAAAGDASASEE